MRRVLNVLCQLVHVVYDAVVMLRRLKIRPQETKHQLWLKAELMFDQETRRQPNESPENYCSETMASVFHCFSKWISSVCWR